jgi:hypothetical protein
MEFEKAAELRDKLLTLQGEEMTKNRPAGLTKIKEHKGKIR